MLSRGRTRESGGSGFVRVVQLFEAREGSPQLFTEPADVGLEPLLLRGRCVCHPPRLLVSLGDDALCLTPSPFSLLLRRRLRRDECLAQEVLELAMPLQLLRELFVPVRELSSLAPDVLEAVGDVVKQPLDGATPVAPEASSYGNVTDFHRRDSHRQWKRSRTLTTTCEAIQRTRIATIGERSSGPNGGRMRRKMRR